MNTFSTDAATIEARHATFLNYHNRVKMARLGRWSPGFSRRLFAFFTTNPI
jgi:hypothetical protein